MHTQRARAHTHTCKWTSVFEKCHINSLQGRVLSQHAILQRLKAQQKVSKYLYPNYACMYCFQDCVQYRIWLDCQCISLYTRRSKNTSLARPYIMHTQLSQTISNLVEDASSVCNCIKAFASSFGLSPEPASQLNAACLLCVCMCCSAAHLCVCEREIVYFYFVVCKSQSMFLGLLLSWKYYHNLCGPDTISLLDLSPFSSLSLSFVLSLSLSLSLSVTT